MHYANAGMLFYGIIVGLSLLAAIAALLIMKYPEAKQGLGMRSILPTLIIGAIIGAKLPVIISYGIRPEFLWTGKSYYGALLGAFIAMNIYKYYAGIKGSTGDRFVVPLCISAAIGKTGCFVYGCCAGIPTDFFLKVKDHTGVYVHPVQIYETAFQLLAGVLFFYLHRSKKLEGSHFLLYMILYMTFRFLVEFIRVEPRLVLGLTVYQMMSVIFVPIFIVILKRRIKNENV